MTTTYEQYRLIKDVEIEAKRLGLKLVPSRFGNYRMALVPTEDNLPIYTRDAEIATGTIEELHSFLVGWSALNMYYTLLGVVNESRVKKAEDRARMDRLAEVIKSGKDPLK